MEYDLDTCPKCGGPADNGFSRDVPPAPYWCRACMLEEELESAKAERDLFANQRNTSNREIEKLRDEAVFMRREIVELHKDVEEARRETVRQIVSYLKLLHDMTPGAHNYYLVAANLIAGEFGENNQPETSTE